MDLRIVKVINMGETYVDKNGKEHIATNYYVVCNDNYIAVRPSFKDGYRQLDLIANVVKND